MDAERVTKSQFKARAFEFFRKIEDTDSPVVVTDHGKPVLEVRCYRVDKCSPAGGAQEQRSGGQATDCVGGRERLGSVALRSHGPAPVGSVRTWWP